MCLNVEMYPNVLFLSNKDWINANGPIENNNNHVFRSSLF
jgi:hypothetical protein